MYCMIHNSNGRTSGSPLWLQTFRLCFEAIIWNIVAKLHAKGSAKTENVALLTDQSRLGGCPSNSRF